MGFRTLHELGHDEKSVQLIDTHERLHGIHLRGSNVVLIPQPSDDVNDPLRWPTWKKNFAFLNICFFAFMVTFYIGGFSPALYRLGLEFGKDLSTTTGLILWALFISGIGNFFWVPFGEYLGKRPTFVVTSLVLFCCTIWSAVSKSYGSLLASRIVGSFAGASTEALGAAMVNDIFFLHERGSKMGMYIMFIYSGNSVGPLLGGFIVQGESWRWFSWFCAVLTGLNFLSIFFFVPESRFNRKKIDQTDPPVETATLQESENDQKIAAVEKVERIQRTTTSTNLGRVGVLKKTFVQELSLWSGTSKESILSHFLRPWLLALYPAVFWGTTVYALCLAWQIGSGTLTSFIFQLPPYNFSPGVNGLINIPSFLGNLFGAFAGGHLTDLYVRYSARRSDGIFHPEARLLLLLIPALIVPAGLLMFGFGAQRHLDWAVLYVGYAFINVVTGVASIAMTYVMDSYYEVAAEGLLMVNGMSKIVAFGFSYGFVPWTGSAGYASVFGTMAGLFLAWMLMSVPLYVFGARVRDYTTTKMRIIFW